MSTLPANPMSAQQILDAYFLETRAKLLEIAANLDRMDPRPNLHQLRGDSRLIFIADALEILKSATPNRAAQIQCLYSKA